MCSEVFSVYLKYSLNLMFIWINVFRPILQKIKHSGEKFIVLDCPIEKLYDVLIQAQQVGLMGSDYNYIITSMVCISN